MEKNMKKQHGCLEMVDFVSRSCTGSDIKQRCFTGVSLVFA